MFKIMEFENGRPSEKFKNDNHSIKVIPLRDRRKSSEVLAQHLVRLPFPGHSHQLSGIVQKLTKTHCGKGSDNELQ